MKCFNIDQEGKINILEIEKKELTEEVLRLKTFIDENLAKDPLENDIFMIKETHKNTVEILKTEIKELEIVNTNLYKETQDLDKLKLELEAALERKTELENERKMWESEKMFLKNDPKQMEFLDLREKVVKKLKQELSQLKSANTELESKVEKLESELRKSQVKIRQYTAKKSQSDCSNISNISDILRNNSNNTELFNMQTPVKTQLFGENTNKNTQSNTQNDKKEKETNENYGDKKRILELETIVHELKNSIKDLRLKKNQEIRVLCNVIYEKYGVED